MTSAIDTRTEIAAQLRMAVARAARRLRQHAGSGLSPSLTSALASIERHGPITPSELASCERVQRPTATRLIAALAEQALVARQPDPGDGRSYRVTVTGRGRTLLESSRRRKTAYLARGLRNLDDDDLATLERATALLEQLLDEER